FPVSGCGGGRGLAGLCGAGAIPESGDGQAGVEGGVAAAEADDGAGGLGDGLHVSPEVERGLEAGIDGARNGGRVAHALVGALIASGIVGEVAAGAKEDFDGVAEAGCGEFFGYQVEPGGAGAGEDGLLREAVFGEQAAGNGDGMLEELADGGFVVEDAFVDFDSAQAQRGLVGEGGEDV